MPEYAPRPCEWCRSMYTPRRRDQRTCGGVCRVKLNKSMQAAKRPTRPRSVTCHGCGMAFHPGHTGKIPARCGACREHHKRRSDAAYGKANRAARNGANRRYRERHEAPPNIISIMCPDCGDLYEKVHTAGRRPTHCPRCSDANRLARVRENTARRRKNTTYFEEYRQRNSAKLTAKALAWAKANREKHNVRGSRYRSRKHSKVVEVFTREEIAARDGWTCAVCKQPVDRTLKHPHPGAGEIDHVIPVTHPDYAQLGHTRSNVTLVHSRCNKHKGGYKGRSG